MITKGKFKQAPISYAQVQPLTPTKPIGDVMNTLGPLLMQALQQSRQPYPGSLDVAESPYTTGAAGALQGQFAGLEDIARTGAPVDTGSIFDAMQSQAQRNIRETAIPSLQESFGVRGGRYGSDFANAVTKYIADTMGNIGIERAKAGVGAGEAAAGRRLSASDIINRIAATLGQIGQGGEARAGGNIQRAIAEFLRMGQAPGAEYFGAAQQFAQTPPIYRQAVAGPTPTYQPGISWLDVANTVAKLAQSGAGIAAVACWIAAAIYGEGTQEFQLARKWIFELWQGPLANSVRNLYLDYGREIALLVRVNPEFREAIKPLFDLAVKYAERSLIESANA